jgi:hypothetical protein
MSKRRRAYNLPGEQREGAMADTIRLSESGTLAIPTEVLQQRGWHVGQDFWLIRCADALRLVPVSSEQTAVLDASSLAPAPGTGQVTLEDLFGMARGADPSAYRDRCDRY